MMEVIRVVQGNDAWEIVESLATYNHGSMYPYVQQKMHNR